MHLIIMQMETNLRFFFLSWNITSGNRGVEKRSAQRIEKTFLEILLLPGKEEKSEEKMVIMLRGGTFCSEKKSLITDDATVPAG